jgi:hypothetical protein
MENPTKLREQAAYFANLAAKTKDDTERATLLRKCEALRALADSEDWLAGKAADVVNAVSEAMPHNIGPLAAE